MVDDRGRQDGDGPSAPTGWPSSGTLPRPEAAFEAAFEHSYNAIVITDADFGGGPFIQRCNTAFCAMTGYTEKELFGQSLCILQGPDTDRKVIDQLNRKIRAGEFFEGSTVNYRKDGVAYVVEWNISPVRDARGQIVAYISIQQDITAHFAAECEVQEARWQQARADDRHRRSMDNAAIGMCIIGPDGRFVEVNDALCQLFGYNDETLKQKTWQELTAQEYLEADLDKVNDIREGRIDTYRMTKQYVHADGHRIWGDLTVSCVRDENGDVEDFMSQITDITAQVEAAERNRVLTQQLQQQTDRLTAELDSAAAYVKSILPDELEGPVRVSSCYLPSQELAGDSFDYRWIDDDRLIAYLIDVSGHGIGPALLSVSVHNLLRSGTLPLTTLLAPDQVLAELNRLFQMDQHDEKYLTMWCGVYELSSRTLRYASAGHPPAIAVIPDAASAATELSTDGQPLGMFDDNAYTSRSYTVPPGCRILLYSDGAYEDARVDGQPFSLTDFTDLFTRLAGSSLDDLAETLRGLTPSGTFGDDCSLVRLEFD